MDFVWPYYAADSHGPELELSVSSVVKHYEGEHRLFVIGDDPGNMVHDVTHIPVPRVTSKKHRAFRDTFNKALIATGHADIDDDFVWIADDVFFVGPVTEEQLRTGMSDNAKSLKRLLTWVPSNEWLKLKKKTLLELNSRGMTDLKDFDTHAPMVINGHKLLKLASEYNMPGNVFLWQTLYGNTYVQNSVDTHVAKYTRITRPMTMERMIPMLTGKSIVNFTNSAWSMECENAVRSSIGFETIDLTRADLPAAERMDQINPCIGGYREFTTDTKRVNVCGRRGQTEPVYRCMKYDELVTINQWRVSAEDRICKKCSEFDWNAHPLVKPESINFPLKGFTAIFAWTPRAGRQAAFDFVQKWAKDRFERVIIESMEPTERWNKSRMLNLAVKKAPEGTCVCLMDADSVITDHSLIMMADRYRKQPDKVYKPFNTVVKLDRDQSEELYRTNDMDRYWQLGSSKHSPGGFTAIAKDLYEKVGGHNEDFEEWGWEDTEFIKRCRNANMEITHLPGTLLHLFHPKNPNRPSLNRSMYYGLAQPKPTTVSTIRMPEDRSGMVAFWRLPQYGPGKVLHDFVVKQGLTPVAISSVSVLSKGMSAAFVWNGGLAKDRQILARSRTLEIPCLTIDRGYLPSGETMVVCESHDYEAKLTQSKPTGTLTEEQDSWLKQKADKYTGGRGRVSTDESPIVGLLEIESELKDSPFTTMLEFANYVERLFPDDSIVFRPHPKAKRQHLGQHTLSDYGDLIDDLAIAKQVVGINSKALYEAVLMDIPTTALGLCPLMNRTHAEQREIVYDLLHRQCLMDVDSLEELLRSELSDSMLEALKLVEALSA